MSDLSEREVALFIAARRLAGAARTAYLDEECAGDAALRQKLLELLSVDETAGKFLEKPALGDSGALTKRGEMIEAPRPLPEKPGDRIGPYKLLEQIGEGGCGVVYVAEQAEPVRRRVALKVIKLGMDTKAVVARFEAERQALAMMDHPNIAMVFDAGTTEAGRPYFVMELVRGTRITDYCDHGKLSPKGRLELFIKVCHAIQHAHQKGIIHRDIKPSNILVTLHDGVPVPKVIDFGIAKATEGRLTETTVYTQFHQFIGTPAYMSLEQVEMSGLDIDTRSDIYSLGVLLYELLTGRTPFDVKELTASGFDAMRKIIREQEPLRPSTRLATLQAEQLTKAAQSRSLDAPKLIHLIRGDLDWVVMKCLEKDRARRYGTANGLAADIRRHLDNEPVVARSPSASYRLQKAWRRNKLAFTAAAMIAGALVLGIAVSSWQAIVASRATNSERVQRLAAQIAQKEAERAQVAEKQAHSRAEAENAEADHLLYIANMNLAQQAWEQNNMSRLRQLLEDTQDSTNRGFEWYYWQRQTHLDVRTFRGHLDSVNCVEYSPDGQKILTGSDDCNAILWDSGSGQPLQNYEWHRDHVTCVAFSPDGRRIVTGSEDHKAKVWDVVSGNPLQTLVGHLNEISGAAFSHDGQRIVTCSTDKSVRVWDAFTGRQNRFFQGGDSEILAMDVSADGQRIVTGSFDGRATVWDLSTDTKLQTIEGDGELISSVACSPNGQRIATAGYDPTPKVWDTATGRLLLKLAGHNDHVTTIAFSPDGRQIATGSDDGMAKLWEADGGRELFSLKGHSAGISGVAFSPDGRWILTASKDGTAKIWNALEEPGVFALKGHTNWVSAGVFSPDGRLIATGSNDHRAMIWDATTGRLLFTFDKHTAEVSSLAFSPDGKRIVTGSLDRTALVWEVVTGRVITTFTKHTAAIWAVAFSPDGQRIISGGDDYTAKVWNASTGEELFPLVGHTAGIRAVAFSRDGERIATGSWDSTAIVWNAADGTKLHQLEYHTGQVFAVAFSPDGRQIVTGSSDRTAMVWDAVSGDQVFPLKGHSGQILSVAFSPDGRRIITGSADHTAKIWDSSNGRELLSLKGHAKGIRSTAFSADGLRIVTGSRDYTARVWDAEQPEHLTAIKAEERAADEFIATKKRERAVKEGRQQILRDTDSIKQWLILAPIPLPVGQTGAEGLDVDQIPNEARLTPKAGDAISIASGELNWRPVSLKDYYIDFNATLGKQTEHSVAYAVCYLNSESKLHGLQILVGSDDEAKIYVNGIEKYKSPISRAFVAEKEQVSDITLKPGVNVLVFKIVNEIAGWTGSIRLADAQGNPVKGIKVTLDPHVNDHP